jgi:hypothetical protein
VRVGAMFAATVTLWPKPLRYNDCHRRAIYETLEQRFQKNIDKLYQRALRSNRLDEFCYRAARPGSPWRRCWRRRQHPTASTPRRAESSILPSVAIAKQSLLYFMSKGTFCGKIGLVYCPRKLRDLGLLLSSHLPFKHATLTQERQHKAQLPYNMLYIVRKNVERAFRRYHLGRHRMTSATRRWI